MDQRPPVRRTLRRVGRPALVAVLVALIAGAVVLIGDTGARDAVRGLVVTKWRLPGPGSATTDALLTPSAAEFDRTGETGDLDGTPLPPPTLHWTPAAASTWQWLPVGVPDLHSPLDVYDLPLATTGAGTVGDIHAAGAHAVCWVPVGIVSTRSPYASAVPTRLLGHRVPSHPDERYLDLRDRAGLRTYVEAQLDDCWRKGFDGADAAHLDTYLSVGPDGVGFPITADDGRAVVRLVAALAHARGLAFGVRTGPAGTTGDAYVADLAAVSDFAVVERCTVAALGCAPFGRLTERGKAVFHVEYLEDFGGATLRTPRPALDRICRVVDGLGFSTILKDGSGANPAWRAHCP